MSSTNTHASTNGFPTQQAIRVPAEAVSRYTNLQEAIRSLRVATVEYLALMDSTAIHVTTAPSTSFTTAMTTFKESFQRAFHDSNMPESDRQSFRYIQEFICRRTFDHAFMLRRETPPSLSAFDVQLDHVAMEIMAVFRGHEEHHVGKNVVSEEVEMLRGMYQE